MEIRLNVTRARAEEVLQSRLAAGAVEVDQSALLTALDHIRTEKTAAIDRQNFDEAASWRDNEKNVIAALGGLGLAQPDEF
jgi:hypothetical protein